MKPRLVDIDIHSYSKKGNGLGIHNHPDGHVWTVEVPFTMVGDHVHANIIRKRSGRHTAELLEVVSSAPERILPRCSHFGTCGGCRWQHLPYSLQLQKKQALVEGYLSPYLNGETVLYPIMPCESPWQYRNKMEFSFSSNRAQDKFLGLIIDSSGGKVLNLQECHLVQQWFIDALHAVKKWWESSTLQAYHCGKNSGSLRTLTLREGVRTGDRLAMLTVSGNADYALTQGHLNSFVESLRGAIDPTMPSGGQLSVFIRIQQIAKGRPTQFYEMHLYGPDSFRETLLVNPCHAAQNAELQFQISPTAFFQPNTLQAEKLYSRVVEMANLTPDAVVYDLYCGTATLGLCFARYAKAVVSIELVPEAVLDARANAKLNGAENITVLQGSVGTVLQQMRQEQRLPAPELVVVDPPRAGLDSSAIEEIVALQPLKIVYVSCNPATQAENVGALIQAGYRLMAIQPVDQFPQTVHIENIALLERVDSVR
jgi:23S rRNA (uracil1939-C5)-methyltransferase